MLHLNSMQSNDTFQSSATCADLADKYNLSMGCQQPVNMADSFTNIGNIDSCPIPATRDLSNYLVLLEPLPISSTIQRVDKLPLTSCLSEDLLKHCDDYCVALQSLNAMRELASQPNSNILPFSMVRSWNDCPKPGVTRSISDSSDVSSSSDMVHIYDYQQERWMDWYHQLANFYNQYGHSDVCNDFDCNLAGWVRRQRHQFKRAKQGRRSTLTSNRVLLLEQVGFKWNFHDLAWNENFERLKAFYKIHKNCNVPTSTCSFGSKEDNERLINWCKRQKRAIRVYLTNKDAAGSRMNAKRLEMLKSIGFCWEPVKKSESPAAA